MNVQLYKYRNDTFITTWITVRLTEKVIEHKIAFHFSKQLLSRTFFAVINILRDMNN
jgi:hypothetical protein